MTHLPKPAAKAAPVPAPRRHDARQCTRSLLIVGAAAALLSGCSWLPSLPSFGGNDKAGSDGLPRKEFIQAVTSSNVLIRFNAGQPAKLLASQALKGLQAGETLLGIDYRIAKGQLYGLGSTGRLYRINTDSAVATPVGVPLPFGLTGSEFGVDFNPTVDRLRVVSNTGMNFRIHPDTGALVDARPDLDGTQLDGVPVFAAGDNNAGVPPALMAAAYTYNKQDEKITTNYAIDGSTRSLVTQGTLEGTTPMVSPNTGRLYTVGPLGVPPFSRASFDISDLNNAAYAALSNGDEGGTRFMEINLKTGAAKEIGRVVAGMTLRGIAIEP
ncbi:MAG: hypothetical protein RJA98_1204 [Pseudomonadota bacterium]|jgi:hypothetical protein